MAVTKIRKISSWTLLISAIISVIVLVMFYVGGVVDPSAEMKEPVNTNLLLNWTFVIFGLTTLCTIGFGLWQFITLFSTNPKSAIISIAAIIGFGLILGISYAIGDGTLLESINADSAQYNTPEWLKITDMWIYTTYILIGLIILAAIAGNVKKLVNR
ncbi:MAG: hypothetical protein LIP01_11860 [Tannerellaceae bacterium]|nr:hypothetical protein [Tannerellaceae bacterium]